jgi:hypothetical protein
MSIVTAKEVQQLMLLKEERKKKSFHKVIEFCSKKIQQNAIRNATWCMYEIPEFIIGYPIYSLNECIQYVYEFLIKKGFRVDYYFPRILFVSWEMPVKKQETCVYSAACEYQQGARSIEHSAPSLSTGVPTNLRGAQEGPKSNSSQFIKSISQFRPSGKFVLNLN